MDLIITPKTKVGDLLKEFPELEKKLIELSPSFEKLKNPVIRKTVAKIATLDQAAKIGDLSVEYLVNTLRKEVGQDKIQINAQLNDKTHKPSWIDDSKIRRIYDAREDINKGGHPLGVVLNDIRQYEPGEQYKLITAFLPAPLIEKVKESGFESWSVKLSDNLFESYFLKL